MLDRILSSQYFKSVLQLATGSIIAQIITILVSPISTRLYTPEQLGIYTLILTFSSMFGPVIAGKYDIAIVSARDTDETVDLIIGSTIFIMIFTIFITIGYTVYLHFNSIIFKEVGWWAYILVFILIIQGLINILSSYNNRYKQYKLISQVYVIRTLVQNIGLVILGMLKMGSVGLLISQLTGLFFGLKKQSKHLLSHKSLLKNINWKRTKNTLVKYKNQPIYSMPAHFINSASYSLINFFISGLFGMTVFGYYSMSYRILGLPLSLVSMNVSKVFFQRASDEKLKIGNYHSSVIHMSFFLLSLSIPMVIIFMAFGPYLFEMVFGAGWDISGKYVQLLGPMYGLRFIVSALSPALVVSGEQKLELVMQSMFITCSIISFLITKYFNLNTNEFLIMISISYSIIYVWFYIAIYKLSKKEN